MMLRAVEVLVALSLAVGPQDRARFRVVDVQAQPISNAEIWTDGSPRQLLGRTGADGTASLPASAKPRQIIVRRIGFMPERIRWNGERTTVTLVTASAQLSAMRVLAPRIPVSEGTYTRPGESERMVGGQRGLIGAGGKGDLQSIAMLLGGAGAEGFSFLGMPGSLSRVSLAGAQSGVTRLPRSADVAVTLLNSPFDPAIGGFAGAALDVELQPGSQFEGRDVSLWTVASKAGGGTRNTTTLSLSATGERDGLFYAASADLDQTGAPPSAIDCTSISGQSIELQPYLSQTVQRAQGAGFSQPCTSQRATGGVAAMRIDHPIGTQRMGALTTHAAFSSASGGSPMAFAMAGATAPSSQRSLTLAYSARDTAVLPRALDRLALSFADERAGARGPFTTLEPGSSPALDSLGRVDVALAGSPSVRTARRVALEFTSRRDLTSTPREALSLTTFGRLASANAAEGLNAGQIFSSVSGLSAAALPDRRTQGTDAEANARIGVFGGSLGFRKDLSGSIRLVGGARAEVLSTSTPTERTTSAVMLSPRLGVEWAPTRMTERGIDVGGGIPVEQLGFGAVRLGIGRYVAWPDETALAERSLSPQAVAPFECGAEGLVASAACPTGTSITVPTAPTSRVAAFQPVSTWRGSGSAEVRVPIGEIALDVSAGVTGSEWLQADANVGPIAGVVDGDRSTFALPSTISPTTFRFPIVASRRDPTLGQQLVWGSTGRRTVAEVSMIFRPKMPDRLTVQLGATLRDARRRPSAIEQPRFAGQRPPMEAAAGVPRYQGSLIIGAWLPRRVRVSGMVSAVGGSPFYPVVASDINGDGFANDRIGPAQQVAQSPTWTSTQRQCLQRAAETRGYCLRPVAMTSWLQADFGGAARVFRKLPDRIRVGVWWAEPLSLLFRDVPRIGQPVEQRAVTVVRYDAPSQRFTYTANPLFLRPVAVQQGVPWRFGVNVSINLAEDPPTQQLRLALIGQPTREADVGRVVQRFRRIVRNPWSLALANAEEIGLDSAQYQLFEQQESTVEARADSIWTALATRALATRGSVPLSALVDEQEETVEAVWEMMKAQRSYLLPMLSPAQQRRLPEFLVYLMTVEKPIRLRLR